MKSSTAFAAIRQIATLGYSGRLVLPALLAAIRDIVPYEKADFAWLDEQCNAYDWHNPVIVPPEAMRFYLEQFHNRRENEEIPCNRQLMHELGSDRSAVLPGFERGDLFNVVFRAGENRHYLRLAVRDGARPLGIFYLLRPPGVTDFTEADEKCLSQVAPWLGHALAVPSPSPAAPETLADAESGLVVADAKGAIVHYSAGARRLLHCATGIPVNHRSLGDARLEWSRALIGNLVGTLNDERKASPAVPAVTIRNADGCFMLRAYWLEGMAIGGARHVAIQIQHHVPLPLRLMQSPQLRRMPPREQQACLLLAQGYSYSEIANRMGISRDGAVYHIRSSYNRLGVSSQTELVRILLNDKA